MYLYLFIYLYVYVCVCVSVCECPRVCVHMCVGALIIKKHIRVYISLYTTYVCA